MLLGHRKSVGNAKYPTVSNHLSFVSLAACRADVLVPSPRRFLWTICTIIVNRFLLRIRAIESSHRAEGYSKHGPEDRVALEMEFVDGRSSVSELLE